MYIFVRGKQWAAVKQKGEKLKLQHLKMNFFFYIEDFLVFFFFFFVYQEVKIVLFVICTQLTHAFFFYKHETK